MKQSFKSKYRKIISLVVALILASGIVGLTHKSWYAKNINISFNMVSTKDITYKVLYTENKNSGFENAKIVAKRVKSGTNDVKIIIPSAKLAKFRLYFGSQPGLLNLSKLKINGDKVIKLNDFVSYEFRNMDSSEVIGDGSITFASEQANPYMDVNQTFDVNRGCDIDFIKVGSFGIILFVLFYVFFLFALREKKKKKKEFYDYY